MGVPSIYLNSLSPVFEGDLALPASCRLGSIFALVTFWAPMIPAGRDLDRPRWACSAPAGLFWGHTALSLSVFIQSISFLLCWRESSSSLQWNLGQGVGGGRKLEASHLLRCSPFCSVSLTLCFSPSPSLTHRKRRGPGRGFVRSRNPKAQEEEKA